MKTQHSASPTPQWSRLAPWLLAVAGYAHSTRLIRRTAVALGLFGCLGGSDDALGQTNLNWQIVNPGPSAHTLSSVANGVTPDDHWVFVAVSGNSFGNFQLPPVALVSSNATDWTEHQILNGLAEFNGITYHNGRFIAAGWDTAGALIAWSDDGGVSWTTNRPGVLTRLYDITIGWANSWVAVGGDSFQGFILTSYDEGQSWEVDQVTLGGVVGGEDIELRGVANTGSGTVAVGTYGNIFRRIQNGPWERLSPVTADHLWDVAGRPGSGILIAVGTNGRILRSADFGASWTVEPRPAADPLYGVTISDDHWVIVGMNGRILVGEQDGTGWTVQTPVVADILYGTAFGQTETGERRFVGVGSFERVVASDPIQQSSGSILVILDNDNSHWDWEGGNGYFTVYSTEVGTAADVNVFSSQSWIQLNETQFSVSSQQSHVVPFQILENRRFDARAGTIFVSGDVTTNLTISQAGGPPYAPVVRGGEIASYGVTSLWNPVPDGAGYTVEKRELTGTNWMPVANLSAAQTNYSESNLAPWMDHLYRVRAFNANGSSEPSQEFGGRTPPAPPPLNVQASGWSQAAITWSDVTGAASYTLQYRIGTGAWFTLLNPATGNTTFPPGVRAYIHSGLTPDSDVSYRIQANASSPYPNLVSDYSEVTTHLPAYNGTIYWGNDVVESLPFGQPDLNDVAYGDGRYIAVGAGGEILSSPDGTNWTAETSGTTNTLKGIVFGGGRFVAAGPDGTVLTSTGDGTWTPQTSGQSVLLGPAAHGNGRFVIVGPDNSVLVSTNGTDWSLQSVTGGTANLGPIGFGNGEFVIGQADGGIFNSTDGMSWTQSRPGTNDIFALRTSFAWNGSLWVAGGPFGRFSTSPDGQTWTDQNAGLLLNMTDIVPNGSGFVGLSEGAFVYRGWISSADGLSWQTNGQPTYASTVLRAAAGGPQGFVSVGSGGYIAHSMDGTSWSEVRPYRSGSSVQMNSLAVQGNTVVAAGTVSADTAPQDGLLWTRDPATQTWTNLTSLLPTGATVLHVSTVNGEFFVAGDSPQGALVLRSPDGLSWTQVTVAGAPAFSQIAYGNGRYVAVAGGEHIYTSIDAISWTTNDVVGDFAVQSANLRQVSYVHGRFYTLGISSPFGMYRSDDGLIWDHVSVSQPGALAAGRAFGGKLLAATGPMGTFVSGDDRNWLSRTNTGNSIAYASGVFLASGPIEGSSSSNRLFASLDAVVWEPAPAGVHDPFEVGGIWTSANGEFYGLGENLTFHRLKVSSQPLTTADTDGVPDLVEDGAPNGGDGNNDGILDSQQPHVASLPGTGGNYLTLAVPTNMMLMDVSLVPNPSPGNTPAEAQFPLGFLAFNVNGITPGAGVAVDFFYPSNIALNAYYKFGPEAGNIAPHWFNFAFDGSTGAEFLAAGHLRLHFVDGQRGDDDLSANGQIADDGGPAFVTPPAPALTVLHTGTNTVVVNWPSPSTGWQLQQNSDLSTTNWATPSELVGDDGTNNFIIVNPPTRQRFYRLFKP